MPTQRQHPGAALVPINLTAPGFAGLNSDAEATILGQEWATTLNNAVFDGAGRVATRKGFSSLTTTPVAGIVKRVFEYTKADNTSELIFSTDADIFSGDATPASVEGSLGIAEGNIKFVNFNDKCIALGTGTSGNPSVYTGTGNFTTITVASGTAPTGGIGTSAFGRLWVVDTDGKTIRYSALIDETKWAVADGGGTIDMSNVWPSGQDVITAIEEFAGDLIIFGLNSTVVWSDGQGSSLGIDPTVMYVSDTVPGVGCVSQFAVTRALGDLWFVSRSGLQTLVRAATEGNQTPTNNMSKNVQSKFQAWLDAEPDDDDLTLTYNPREELVVCNFPAVDKCMVFDTRRQMEDGTYRATEWSIALETLAYRPSTQKFIGTLTAVVGEVMNYAGSNDDGSSFSFSYESGWLDLGQELSQYIKFLKKLTSFVLVDNDTDMNYTVKYDFNSVAKSTIISVTGSGGAEFNVAEFNIAEFSGGASLRAIPIPGKGSGQYIKVGVTLDNASGNFALQQINLFAKVGRIAT